MTRTHYISVERLGWVTRGEFFAQVELSVFPSVRAEPFGLVVAEAQYAGAPFVISDAGALPEVAGFNHPWVSPAGDAEALASVVEQALIGTQDAVIAAAQLRWKTHFSPTAGRTRLASFLKTIDIDRITRRT
ncbi:glycosyltransferase family 4 protein [Propioniciclava tarda]|uniref:glycosyltransferase family 4 protein n=1 Tax=Propioniciclava tarda TaxID=433330 RepID=UPI0013F17BFE